MHIASYYAATTALDPAQPPLEGAVDCDVCVLGAGYSGLSAALHLAERGYDVVVVERARIGWGASGRNGGQIVSGYAADMPDIEAALGRGTAQRLWDMAEEAKALLHGRILRHDIECDLKPGYLFAARKPRHLEAARRTADCWQSYGYDQAHAVCWDELESFVTSPLYCGGLYDAGGGHLHPLKYAQGLGRACRAAGVRIYEGTPVIALDRGVQPVVTTANGLVRARDVVLCGNAYLTPLAPDIQSRILPVATHMIATAPLRPEQARRLMPRDVAVSDLNHIMDYYRLSADRRLLFGGGADYWTTTPRGVAARLRRRMLHVFPQLADVEIDYEWSGNVAVTVSRMPCFGRIGTNMWFAHGFSGHGVVLSGLAGKLIAEAVAGTAERFDLFTHLPHRPFPGGPLRAPLLALAMIWYRLRDAL